MRSSLWCPYTCRLRHHLFVTSAVGVCVICLLPGLNCLGGRCACTTTFRCNQYVLLSGVYMRVMHGCALHGTAHGYVYIDI